MKNKFSVDGFLLFLAFIFPAFAFTQTNPILPDSGFVRIPANNSFRFITDLTNTANSGESSPIASDYCLGKYLVTNEQFKTYLNATGGKAYPGYWSGGTFPEGKGKHPVLSVSLTEATAYCAWLSSSYPGWTIRIPPEAELENASAGPDKYSYPWGNSQNTSFSNGKLTSLFNYNGVVAAYFLANNASQLATYNNSNSTRYNQKEAIHSIITISSSGGVSGWVDHTNYTGFIYTDVFDLLMES
jgi:hypothetical protein